MSSASFGPYKSRLFNFINRQSLRWGDRIGRGLRNLQVAATWGGQILLYPIYLLVQSTRAAGHKFSQAVQEAELPQPETTAQNITPSTPILNLLQEIKPLLNSSGKIVRQSPQTIEKKQTTLTKTKITIQGVATLLGDRNLVLVSNSNEIIDILTPQQQQKLQQRIAWEIANYRRHLRLLQSASQKGYAPIQPREKPQIFAPIRLFWHLMHWVQISPVATAINLFQEAVFVKHAVPSLTPASSLANLFSQIILPPESLINLDLVVANIESNGLVPVAKVVSGITESWGGKLQNFKAGLTNYSPNSQKELGQIKALIMAAIQYFFRGKTSAQKLPEPSISSKQLPKKSFFSLPTKLKNLWQRQLNFWQQSALVKFSPFQPTTQEKIQLEPDPWLSWSDLYGNTLDAEITEDEPLVSPPRLTGWDRQPRTTKNSLLTSVKKHLSSKDADLAKPKPTTQTITTFTPAIATVTANQEQLDPAFDWIETEGVHLGYVKHPLEVILCFLDQAIAWLEEMVIKIWQWLFQGNS